MLIEFVRKVCNEVDYSTEDSLLVERRTRGRKVASSSPGRSGGRISSTELTLCADSYSVSVPPPCYRNGM